MGTGAVVSMLLELVHPSKEIRAKYPVRAPTNWFEGCIVVGDAVKTNPCKKAAVIYSAITIFQMLHHLPVAGI